MAIVPVRRRVPAPDLSNINPPPRQRPPSPPPAGREEPGDGYRVGHKRPPRQHQFQKGHKGGPGRPPKSRNVDTVVCDVLEAKRTVMLEGRECKLAKVDMLVHKQVEKAMKGDHRVAAWLLGRYEGVQHAKQARIAQSAPDTTADDDLAILAAFRATLSMGEPVTPAATGPADVVLPQSAPAVPEDASDEDDWLDDEEEDGDDDL